MMRELLGGTGRRTWQVQLVGRDFFFFLFIYIFLFTFPSFRGSFIYEGRDVLFVRVGRPRPRKTGFMVFLADVDQNMGDSCRAGQIPGPGCKKNRRPTPPRLNNIYTYIC
jgi:hypothetical protein